MIASQRIWFIARIADRESKREIYVQFQSNGTRGEFLMGSGLIKGESEIKYPHNLRQRWPTYCIH